MTKRGSLSNVKNMTDGFSKKHKFMIFILLPILCLVTLVIIVGGVFIYNIDKEMMLKMEQKQMILPTVFYSRAETWKTGDLLPLENLKQTLNKNLRFREGDQKLFAGDFFIAQGLNCTQYFEAGIEILESDQCLRIFWDKGVHPLFKEPWVESVLYSSDLIIKNITQGDIPSKVEQFVFMPEVIAQYLGGEPILRAEASLPDIPVACLNAIISIEDAKFLEHRGVSLLGIFRALAVNLVKGRRAQGGSTLTQQLVKNYFLSSEKTIKRKALEFIMAILIESHFDKDLILETYLNIIYMGQQGPYQVRGYGAAARFYFQKSISDLSVSQCSLLAAIVNSPGQYNPFLNPSKAKERRNLVLQKMEDLKFLTPAEKSAAEIEPLPTNQNADLYSTMPYFLQAVIAQSKELGIEDLSGYRIFTTLDLRLQESAQSAIINNLNQIESQNARIKKINEKQKIKLESSQVSVDIATGGVRSVVGGRSFKVTQFNRILSSKRQVGSTFKPFVYLTALISDNPSTYDPLTEIEDEPFTHQYGKQKWSPENYDHLYFGKIPFYFGLKESLNLATAQLALKIGLDPIIDVVRKLGIKSELNPVPSLSLGAFELNPLEMLQSYLTIARFGNYLPITFIDYLEDPNGNIYWDLNRRESEDKISSVSTQILIGILKQTILTGTAQKISQSGFSKIVAGKTGTTNDFKDSWFVGFTPDLLAIVWTGYDNNTSSGLTGASGAIPAWLEFMNEATKYNEVRDFPWSEEVDQRSIPTSDLKSNGFWNHKESKEPEEVNLIFRK